MKHWNTQKKVAVVVSLLVVFALAFGIYRVFFHGPDSEGGHNIAVYLEGKPMDVDVFSGELNRYIYKNLENGKYVRNVLDVSPDRVGMFGGILRFEGKDWDRNITITFADQDVQLIRNVVEKSTGLNLRLYITMSWQTKLKNTSGWSITIHGGE